MVEVDPFDLYFADRRDERRFEDTRRASELDSDWQEEQVSPEWHEGTALHRAAYGDHDLVDL